MVYVYMKIGSKIKLDPIYNDYSYSLISIPAF